MTDSLTRELLAVRERARTRDRNLRPISREEGERNRRILAAAIGIDDYQESEEK